MDIQLLKSFEASVQKCSVKKLFWKILEKFQGKHFVLDSYFISL